MARWVSGSREHLVVLRPYDEGLILHTMYYADEVRDFSAIEREDSQVKDKEIALAEMLINELSVDEFDPLVYKDGYRERLMNKIRAKSEGETIVSGAPDDGKAAEVVDIMEALRRSLEGGGVGGKKRASAKKAPQTRVSASRKKKVS
jgi:DNA end-binding protein Ku